MHISKEKFLMQNASNLFEGKLLKSPVRQMKLGSCQTAIARRQYNDNLYRHVIRAHASPNSCGVLRWVILFLQNKNVFSWMSP